MNSVFSFRSCFLRFSISLSFWVSYLSFWLSYFFNWTIYSSLSFFYFCMSFIWVSTFSKFFYTSSYTPAEDICLLAPESFLIGARSHGSGGWGFVSSGSFFVRCWFFISFFFSAFIYFLTSKLCIFATKFCGFLSLSSSFLGAIGYALVVTFWSYFDCCFAAFSAGAAIACGSSGIFCISADGCFKYPTISFTCRDIFSISRACCFVFCFYFTYAISWFADFSILARKSKNSSFAYLYYCAAFCFYSAYARLACALACSISLKRLSLALMYCYWTWACCFDSSWTAFYRSLCASSLNFSIDSNRLFLASWYSASYASAYANMGDLCFSLEISTEVAPWRSKK